MNVQEVAGLIAYFGSAWPSWKPSDDTADVWLMELSDIDADVAREAAKNLVQHEQFAPSIARFRQECRTVTHHRNMRRSDAAGLPSGPRVPIPKELLEASRAVLAQASSSKKNGRRPA